MFAPNRCITKEKVAYKIKNLVLILYLDFRFYWNDN